MSSSSSSMQVLSLKKWLESIDTKVQLHTGHIAIIERRKSERWVSYKALILFRLKGKKN